MEQYQNYYIISTRPKVFRCNRGIEEDVWLHSDFKQAEKKVAKWRMKDDAGFSKSLILDNATNLYSFHNEHSYVDVVIVFVLFCLYVVFNVVW